jgi:ATP-dependent DNA helicase RecQ
MPDPDRSRTLAALKRWFGFDAFRPGQQAVIDDALAGRDLLAIMPTGGGKSLCFQLPALLRPGVMVVVSPLIALMQDQVRLLRDNGISAAFLNSSLSARDAADTMSALLRGELRLLYLAPERLLMPDFLTGFLPRLKDAQGLSGFTIDEAHCVSEWGHDFRPEYRQMHCLREHFPDVPVFAFTATATGRVRDDICHQLGLREPAVHVSSFNRPNLHYSVTPKDGRTYGALLDRARRRPQDAGIVYCLSRKRVDELASSLKDDGIRALPYHAGLNADRRRDNQDAFIRDDAQVIVATIAFGMGINKPDVRWVVHYDLPKTMEGYYQEAGRAGRDSGPADCCLYFGIGDIRTAEFLIAQKTDPATGEPLEAEQRLAKQQLRRVLDYAESTECRRVIQLRHFGEHYDPPCGACDNCLDPKPVEDWTLEARQFLSAIARLAQRGERYGAAYLIDLLRGAETQKVIDRGHQALSVYGIGKSRSQDEWRLLVRALVQQGLVAESGAEFPVLVLAEASRAVLKGEHPVRLAIAPKPAKAKRRRGAVDEIDRAALPEAEALFEALRDLRKRLADEQGVPPYVVFSDASLRQMAERQPLTSTAFLDISGVGSRKLAQYGAAFTATIRGFRSERGMAVPAEAAAEDASAFVVDTGPIIDEDLPDTVVQTGALFDRGLEVDAIATHRRLDAATVIGHLEALLAHGTAIDLSRLVPHDRAQRIVAALSQHGGARLKPAWEALGGEVRYEDLRLVRAWLHGRSARAGNPA